MLRFILFVFVILVQPVIWAGPDLSVGGSYRSFPVGGAAEIHAGYGYLLWGSEKNPIYGFMRLGVDLEGVENYIATTAKVEVFPLSILGVIAGRSWSQSHLDYEDFDCKSYLCRGQFIEDFVEVPLYAGYGPIRLAASYRQSHWQNAESKSTGGKALYIEPTSGIKLANSETETLSRVRGALFLELTANCRVGYAETFYSVVDSITGERDRQSHLWLGLLQFHSEKIFTSEGEFSLVLGGGEYDSNFKLHDPTFIVGFELSPLPRLGY